MDVDYPLRASTRGFPTLYVAGVGKCAQHSAKLLADGIASISFEELLKYKHSTLMLLFDRVKDDLSAAVRDHGSEQAKKAMAILEQWDGRADAESRGAVLFSFWISAWGKDINTAFATKWIPTKPLLTPDGFASPKAAAKMLDAAGREVEKQFGAMDVAYGDVYRLHYGDVDLPGNGASGDDGDGAFRVVYFEPVGKVMQSAGGDSYYAAIEFSSPPRARVLTAYGSSSQPTSPHRGDQLALFAKQQMRPALRTRNEIEANLERREELKFESASRH